MSKINREDLHIISRHSNLSTIDVVKILKSNIYSDAASWSKFLKLFFISLGFCFTTAGIIFFFAYNWDELHKFYKIGIVEGLIILTVGTILFIKINKTVKNIILTGASIFVGVLFAVFGQIYQTGANAYDFFLGWTMSITLWVLISNFAPLWLLFLTLINTVIILYSEQVANDWSTSFLFTLLFLVNTIPLIVSELLSKNKVFLVSKWFTNLVALVAVTFSTIGISSGIFDEFEIFFLILILSTVISYSLGIKFGLKTKNIFYFAIIAFSLIIITTSFLINISPNEAMIFLISIFIIGSVTGTIKYLIDIQKKWHNEKQ